MRLLVLVLLLVPGLATAQVYKCVDKDGRVKYVQTKPKGDECSGDVPSAPPPMGSGEAADPYKSIGEQAQQRQATEAKTRDASEREQAAKQQRCAQWRARLAALERANRVFTVDEKGERHYQSDQQNDAMREEARQGVAQECS